MEGRILTDPELFKDDYQEELQTIRKKNLKIQFLESENSSLQQRVRDLEKTVKINKEIIGALVDATMNQDYKSSFELFQQEIKNLIGSKQQQLQ